MLLAFIFVVIPRCKEQEHNELKIFLSLDQNNDVTQSCFTKWRDRDRDDRYSFNDRMIISLCNSINIASVFAISHYLWWKQCLEVTSTIKDTMKKNIEGHIVNLTIFLYVSGSLIS